MLFFFSINRSLWLSLMMLSGLFFYVLNSSSLTSLCFFCTQFFCYCFNFYRVVLVENIPEDISFLDNSTSHVPLSVGLYNLLDQAIRNVEIVSPLWLLNSSDYESSFQPAARQVKLEQVNRELTLQKLCHLFNFYVLYLFYVSSCVSLSELSSLPPLVLLSSLK